MQLQPIKQSFQVQYDYQLYFTSGLFALENQMFVNLIADYKDFEPVKLLFVLDDGVKHHHPSLIPQIEDYCKAHRQTIKYTDTLVLPG
ncbi:MAG TPA: 3-dehydroquinate synthase, partial [Maribacter sp.]|nr:3-dehydroquinate synthase [Maribacter sp.]